MLEPDFDEKASRRHGYHPRSRKLRLIGLVCIALLVSCLLGFPGYARRPYTCAVCRADKVDYHILGLKWSDQQDTEWSRWYRDHVERSHAHAWIGCTSCRRFGIPGLAGGYACFVGGPLTGLSRTVQMTIYQHFEDRLEAKRLFLRLGQMDAEGPRLWEALMGWVDQDYPGTWHEWWEQQRANVK
jgi:hypothetical protein